MLNDPAKLLKRLIEFDKDNIPPELTRLMPYIKTPEFEPEKSKKASKAA